MDEKETVGFVEHDRMQDVAGVGHRFVETTVGHGEVAGGAETGIEEGKAKGLVVEVAQLRSEDLVARRGGIESELGGPFACHA